MQLYLNFVVESPAMSFVWETNSTSITIFSMINQFLLVTQIHLIKIWLIMTSCHVQLARHKHSHYRMFQETIIHPMEGLYRELIHRHISIIDTNYLHILFVLHSKRPHSRWLLKSSDFIVQQEKKVKILAWSKLKMLDFIFFVSVGPMKRVEPIVPTDSIRCMCQPCCNLGVKAHIRASLKCFVVWLWGEIRRQ